MVMEKPPAWNGAIAAVIFVFALLILITCAVAEQALHGPVGVTTKFTEEVEPACSVGIVQTTPLPTGELQLPEPAVALVNVTPLDTDPLTNMPVAKSGPWFVTVKVMVTGLPALIIPVDE
jgi:hypothetical protein